MFRLVQKRRWFFLISAILILPGIAAMIYSWATIGSLFHLSIDFTSGSMLELRFEQVVDLEDVRVALAAAGFEDSTVQNVNDDYTVAIRTTEMEVSQKDALEQALSAEFGTAEELSFESVGPTVGRETTSAAVRAILAASVAILLFVALAFRTVPNAFRYGISAIAKMFHDVLFLLGLASILGLVMDWEVDSLFLTALVTVIGFSVQDVIVVFDRIRENTKRRHGEPFDVIVNRSLLETIHRSLATQLNAIFIMVAIIFFGGATIQQFMIIMLVGMVTGTYSSLFFAVPLLAAWNEGDFDRLLHPKRRQNAAA
jgi:preprotein translocase SecF subunit